METTPEEAYLIFEKWQATGSEILCIGTLFCFGFSMRGKVVSASRDFVDLASDDKPCTLRVKLLEEDSVFGFAVPPEDLKSTEGLVMRLPLRFTPGMLQGPLTQPTRDSLSFFALG